MVICLSAHALACSFVRPGLAPISRDAERGKVLVSQGNIPDMSVTSTWTAPRRSVRALLRVSSVMAGGASSMVASAMVSVIVGADAGFAVLRS